MAETTRTDSVRLPSDPARFRAARHWLAAIAARAGYTPGAIHDLSVALAEACVNAHRHAYAGRTDGRVDVAVDVKPDRLTVSVRDYGLSFDPQTWRRPDLRAPQEGGYGLFLMHHLMDEVRYSTVDSGTRVVMTKFRQRERRAIREE